MAEAGEARAVPVGGGLGLACLLCGGSSFWRRYPKAVNRVDQHLLLTDAVAHQPLDELRKGQEWLGFAEVCATCGFVHWFSSEAHKRRAASG